MIDLDVIHWEGEGYSQRRDKQSAIQMATEAATSPQWIIEGVFGWLAEVLVDRATALIWIDLRGMIARWGS